jgi:hypothetical protein
VGTKPSGSSPSAAGTPGNLVMFSMMFSSIGEGPGKSRGW